MDIRQLEERLRRYSPREEALLRGGGEAEAAAKAAGQTPVLQGSHYFPSPEQRITVSRQDRFEAIKPHRHDFIELCYVWSGECCQTVEGREISVAKGDICILDTQAMHSFKAGGEEDILINILIRREFFDSAVLHRMRRQGSVYEFLVDAVLENRARQHYMYFPARDSQAVRDLVSRMVTEHFEDKPGKETVLESCLVILFTELFRLLLAQGGEETAPKADGRLLELLDYIDRHCETGSLNEMGRHFGLNPNYLTALLKEKTGRSYLEHIQEKRLQKARLLLEGTDMPVAEVVGRCGYQNMNFFYRKFKKAEGCTPLEYRRRMQRP